MSVRSKETNTISPLLLELVYKNIKLSPIGGRLVAPESPVGLFVLVDRKKFCILPLLFLSLHFIFHRCNRYPPLLGALIIVVTVICILSYLVKLYVSFPTVTFR